MSAVVMLVMLVFNFQQLNGAPMNDHGASLNQRFQRTVSVGAERQAALDAHNRLRSLEALTAPASNMEAVVWNDDVAALAYNWAQRCQWSHDPTISSLSTPVGQNLYAVSGETLNVTKAIEAWYNEKPDYDYDTLICKPGKMCGHYTQVVWGWSYEIGCAVFRCPVINCSAMFGCPNTKQGGPLPNADMYACDYRQAGNYAQTKPYTKGPACTNCPNGKLWCSNGLCNASCSASGSSCTCPANDCNGHGSLDPFSCTCNCNPGWKGTICQNLDGSSTPITRTSYSTTAILIFVICFTIFAMRDDFF